MTNKTWTITVPKGMTAEKAYQLCTKEFTCYRYVDNFDDITEDRVADKEYTVTVNAHIEADENLKNLSVNDIKEKGIKTLTLTERLLLELQYFKDTKKHLDIDNWTLCSGSRDSDGDVPSCRWCDSGFVVSWYCPGSRFDYLRAREVVSLSLDTFPSVPLSENKIEGKWEEHIVGKIKVFEPTPTKIEFNGRIYRLEERKANEKK